jgi:hypothetical protein
VSPIFLPRYNQVMHAVKIEDKKPRSRRGRQREEVREAAGENL